jgi:hypothetical protein
MRPQARGLQAHLSRERFSDGLQADTPRDSWYLRMSAILRRRTPRRMLRESKGCSDWLSAQYSTSVITGHEYIIIIRIAKIYRRFDLGMHKGQYNGN